jgi:hypothetical protein
VLSSVENFFGCSWGVFCSYYQARRGLDVLPAHATRGKDGVTSDWLCMWREGALGPAINIVASLCADVRVFGSALRMGAPAAGFLFLLGADWSGALVRPRVAGPRRLVPSHSHHSHNYVGVVGGALASWGPIVQLARSVDVTTFHTTTLGSWEVHSYVGLVSAGGDPLWHLWVVGRIEPCGGSVGGWAEVLCWDVPGANGMTAGGCLLSFAP